MASTISTVGFDAAYPVAGQDNDSQGFRTNFNVTKVALEQAASEITTLQSSAAKLDADNEFNGSIISEAEMKANTETLYPNSLVTSSQNISWVNGHYQTLQAGADITLTFADWPTTGVMGKLRLHLTGDGTVAIPTSRVVTFVSSGPVITDGNVAWTGSNALSTPITIELGLSTDVTIIDFWTINGGSIVFANYIGTFN